MEGLEWNETEENRVRWDARHSLALCGRSRRRRMLHLARGQADAPVAPCTLVCSCHRIQLLSRSVFCDSIVFSTTQLHAPSSSVRPLALTTFWPCPSPLLEAKRYGDEVDESPAPPPPPLPPPAPPSPQVPGGRGGSSSRRDALRGSSSSCRCCGGRERNGSREVH